MKIRIKSVKSKIIVFFIGLAAFQICVMAGFAKLQLEPSIVSMYSEHLERFADVALTETTQETEKIERYMVNIIGDAQIQDFLRRADEEQSAELPPVLSTELRNRILSYTDYDNIITAIYLVDNYGRIYSNLGKKPYADLYEPQSGVERQEGGVCCLVWRGKWKYHNGVPERQ